MPPHERKHGTDGEPKSQPLGRQQQSTQKVGALRQKGRTGITKLRLERESGLLAAREVVAERMAAENALDRFFGTARPVRRATFPRHAAIMGENSTIQSVDGL